MQGIWLAAVMAGLALLAPAAPVPAASAPTQAAAQHSILAPRQSDRILGNPNAPITIIEYASLSCPHCAHFDEDVLPQIKKHWIDTGKAKLILRDFPLDAPALMAAMIARCAPPDRFYPFVNALFADQQQWVLAANEQEALLRIAKLGGISTQKAETCLKNKALEDSIVRERLVAAQDLGVNATPTFFVNGKKFTGEPTVAAFDQLLSSLAPKA
ncbi:MAG TPA: DsbA family protein [Stellaceae bacterium]|nr:DsbA family protein [Stellaceae bacterium]